MPPTFLAQRIRHLSPLTGLHRRQLTGIAVLAQSVAAVAPSAAMVTLPLIVIAGVGSTAVACFAAATAIVILVGYCISHFAQRMASASGLYSYAAKGFGPATGFTAGWALLIGYFSAAAASALAGALYLWSLLDVIGLADGSSRAAIAAGTVVISVLAALLMRMEIRVSARVSLGLELLSTAVVLVVLVILGSGHHTSAPHPATAAKPDFEAVALGVVLAVTSFVGFESAGTLGVETRRPLITIPRALRWTPLLLGALYLFAVITQVHLFRDASTGLLHDALPVVGLARSQGDVTVAAVLDVGIVASWFACVMGSGSAFVRVLFSLGREGLLPAGLGRTHPRYGSPNRAIFVFLPLCAGIPVALLATGLSPRDALVTLLTLSALGYLVAYALTCAATPSFLWRIGELTVGPAVAGVLGSVTMVFLIGAALVGQFSSERATPYVFLGLLAVGPVFLWVMRRKDPAAVNRAGVYDETTVDDVYTGTTP